MHLGQCGLIGKRVRRVLLETELTGYGTEHLSSSSQRTKEASLCLFKARDDQDSHKIHRKDSPSWNPTCNLITICRMGYLFFEDFDIYSELVQTVL